MSFLWVFIHSFCALFAVLGVVLLAVGLRDALRAARTRRWPTTAGTVVSTEVVPHRRTVETASGSQLQIHYEARVHYEYTLGHTHVGSSVLRLNALETSSEAHAQAVLSRYPPGQAVQVSYSPVDPTDSVLEPGAHPADFIRCAIGVVFLLVAGGIELAARWFLSRP